MTKEEKQLLLIDLCARLPHHVKIHTWYGEVVTSDLNTFPFSMDEMDEEDMWDQLNGFKPYLRPISSMTDDEIDKLFDILHIDKSGNGEDWIKINDVLGIKFFFPTGKWVENVIEAYDYLNSIHIDYRGFIEKGLALEALEGMYKTE